MAQEGKQRAYLVNSPGDTLNLRTTPGASDAANVATAVQHGTELQGTGRVVRVGSQKWIEVVHESLRLWAAEKYLTLVDPARPSKQGPPVVEGSPLLRNFKWD